LPLYASLQPVLYVHVANFWAFGYLFAHASFSTPKSVLSIRRVAQAKKQAICGVSMLAWHQLFCLENGLMLSGNHKSSKFSFCY
jgi:hypothetical protein